MPTDTKTTNATEREYRIEARLFLKRWPERFLSMRVKSVLFIQNKETYATTFYRIY